MSGLVVVTGGSRGIGRAIAETVPFVGRVVTISRGGGVGDRSIEADLADPRSWSEVGAALGTEIAAVPDGERIVFVHAAGTLTPIGFAGETDLDDYTRAVLLGSAAGQALGARFLALVADRRGPRDLVMLTSGAASSVYPGWSAYAAGKAALDHWVRTVGAEQRERGGVRICAIAPGVVDTAMQDEIRRTDPADFPAVGRFERLHRDGDLADPHTVARRAWAIVTAGVEPGSVLDLRGA